MEEFISNFHFLRPWWLLLVLLPLLGYARFFSGLKNVSAWEGVCDKNLLDFLLVRGSSKQRSLVANLLLAGMLGAIVAAAGPSWQKKDIPAFAPENPVMFLLNLSSDMDATDVTPNRLTRAKYAISDLLKHLGNAQSGLIVYSDEPFLISPLTEDTKVINNLLSAVTPDIMPENGDRLNRALDYAVKRLQESGYKEGNIVVLAADVGQDFNIAMMSSAAAAAKGYEVSVVAVNAKGSEKLKMIAEKGDGIYVGIGSGIDRLSAYLHSTDAGELKQSENQREIWQDAGYYLLILPLLCALYFFRRGIMVVALLLSFAHTAEAGFLLNDNQEGMKAFNNQDYATAASKFTDKNWKATSHYRAGSYDEAYKFFAGEDAESLYNQGNALAKGGKFEEAIKNYEKVLELEPEHEDAKFNLEYLKQQQKNQQQQQPDENKQDKQDKQDQKQQSGQDNREQQGDKQQQEQDKSEKSKQNPEQNSDSGGKGDQDEKKQTPQPQPGKENEDEKDNRQDSQQSSAPQPTEAGDKTEEEAKAAATAEQKPEDNSQKYDEAVQAREQQFRDIPEDSGGLLRAFIRKEYMKNRYKDN